MLKHYYRKVNKSNIKKMKEDYETNPNSIRLQPVINEFDCNDNCLSVYENRGGKSDECETAIVFTTLHFENYYIILNDNDFDRLGIKKPVEGPCSIGYIKGEEIHRNIPELKVSSIDALVKMFSSKELLKIDKKKGKKLLLIAYKDSLINQNNLKQPFFLAKISEALNSDNEVYDAKVRLSLLIDVQKQLEDLTNEMINQFIAKKRSLLPNDN